MSGKVEREGLKHGTINAYGNHGCRCDECKLAYREYQLVSKAKLKERGLDRYDPRHGTYSAYTNYGCRCSACTESNRVYAQDYRSRKSAKTA